jgi:hypothetical protein
MVSNWTHKIWSIIVLLDSICPKDSNDISFAIFGSIEQKLWFSEDLDQIWFQIPIRVSVLSSGCHVLCSDWSIPFRVDRVLQPLDLMWYGWTRSKDNCSVSDLSWSFGSWSDGVWARKRILTGLARFPTSSGDVAARDRTPAMLRWSPIADGELDGDQWDAGKTRAWTASLIASSSRSEDRLESSWLWKAPVEHPWVDLQGNRTNGRH